MTTLRKYRFPFRLSDKQLPALYASLEEAFGVRDFLYVARYGESNPELHGCALIMLGNRVGMVKAHSGPREDQDPQYLSLSRLCRMARR